MIKSNNDIFRPNYKILILFLSLLIFIVVSILTYFIINFLYKQNIQQIKKRLLSQVRNEKQSIEILTDILENTDSTFLYLHKYSQISRYIDKFSELFLIDQTNKSIMLHFKQSSVNETLNKKNSIIEPLIKLNISVKGNDLVLQTYDYRNKEVIAAITKIDNKNWLIIYKSDLDHIWRYYLNYGLLILLIELIFIGIGIYINFRVMQKNIENDSLAALKYKLTFDKLPVASVVFDESGKIIEFNNNFIKFIEFNGNLFSHNIKEFEIISNDKFNENIEKLKSENHLKFCYKSVYRNQNGEKISVECCLSSIHIIENTYFLCTVSDINENHNKLIELENAKEYLTKLLNFSSVPIIVWDRDYLIKGFNHAFEELTGRKENSVLGKHIGILFPHEEIEKSIEILQDTSSGKRLKSIDLNIITTDGRVRNCLWNSAGIFDNNGQLISTIAQSIDITERIKVESDLRDSELKFRTLVETISDIIWQTDPEGHYTYVSPQVKSILGYSVSELIGKTPFDLMDDVEKQKNLIISEQIVKSQKPFYNLINKLRKKSDDYIILETSGAPIYDNDNHFIGYRGISHDATLRFQTMELLKKSEERFRLLFKENQSIMLLIDSDDGSIVDVNDSAIKYYGWTYDDFINKKISEINTLQNDEMMLELSKTLNKEKNYFEYQHRKSDGTITDVQVYTSIILINDKKHLFSIINDISERKKAIAELKSNHDRLNQIINVYDYKYKSIQDLLDYSLNEAIKLTGSKIGYIYYYNEEKKEFILNSWSNEVMKDCRVVDPATCYELDKTGLWGEAVRQQKVIIINDFDAFNPNKKGYPDGHIHLKKFMTLPIFDNDKIVAVVGVANKESDYNENDVSQLRLLMNSVWRIVKREEAEFKIRLLIQSTEQSPAGIIITDANGIIEYANSMMARISGYTIDELIGNSTKLLNSGYHDDDYYKDMWLTITSGNTWHNEFCNRKKNGELYWEITSISPIFNDHGDITNFVAVKEDITERKAMLTQYIKAKELAQESERLKAFFLANMSHEIRTPMSGILGFTGLIEDSTDLADAKELAVIARQSALRLMDTLSMIIDLAKLESGTTKLDYEDVDIAYILTEQFAIKNELAKNKSIEIILDLKYSELMFNTSRVAIETIVSQLLSNALKFTKKGYVKLCSELTNEGTLLIKVEDSGIGIDEKNYGLIFKEFRQVDEGLNRDHEGPGLGLSLVKKFCNLLGAAIKIDSQIGNGSTFSVYIPQKNIKFQNGLIYNNLYLNNSDELAIEDRDVRILIVEDNEITLKLLSALLREFMFVDFCKNQSETEKMVYLKDYDIIFMDINLGRGGNGVEITKNIRILDKFKNTPIIAMTTLSPLTNKNQFIEWGFVDLLGKPFVKDDIIKLIQKHCIERKNKQSIL